LNCSTSHYSNIAIIYDSDLMCIHSLLWKKIVHIIMVYGQRTEARIQYRGTREESTRVSKERRNSEDSNIKEDVHLNEYDEEPTEILACFSMLPNDILNDDENNKQLHQV
ncbi:unnamed protein product, partial [Rotaria magnacalcarata]